MDRRRPEQRTPRPDDAGFSLTELMVTMGIMSVLMVMFTTAILQVYGTSATTESISIAQTQLHVAFQRFDRELRYASWIAEPGMVGTSWYVEFAAADVTQCAQLRFDTAPALTPDNAVDGDGLLQLIHWTRGDPPLAGAPGQTIASLLLTQDVDQPFVLQAAGSLPYLDSSPDTVGADFATDFQRLRIRLTARVGTDTTQVDTTFTALNTSRNTPRENDCSEGRPV